MCLLKETTQAILSELPSAGVFIGFRNEPLCITFQWQLRSNLNYLNYIINTM